MASKKFLIITSSRSTTSKWADREKYVHDFNDSLANKLDDVMVNYTTYDDITCLVQDGAVQLYDTKHALDLRQVDIVHFKNWMFDSEYAATIAAYLENYGVTYFNSEVNAGLAWGKISQMCRLALCSVPVPDTYFAKNAKLIELFETNALPAGFNLPLILKADQGSKGNDNYLVKTQREALGILAAADDKDFVVQKFLPNDGDYRFLFMGLDNQPLVFHRQGVEGSHLNNTSQGGSGTLIAVDDLPAGYVAMAAQAAKVLGREIGGVDIIVDKNTGKPYVLEVNSTPALATGYAIEAKNAKFADFLQQLFAAQEEE